jgi:molybdopterin converting factor subunit 1
MIEVTVKLFAGLRQQAGWSEKRFALPAGSTVAELITVLATEEGLAVTGRAIHTAVNQEYAQPDRVLQSGDIAAVFPPVSGGR